MGGSGEDGPVVVHPTTIYQCILMYLWRTHRDRVLKWLKHVQNQNKVRGRVSIEHLFRRTSGVVLVPRVGVLWPLPPQALKTRNDLSVVFSSERKVLYGRCSKGFSTNHSLQELENWIWSQKSGVEKMCPKSTVDFWSHPAMLCHAVQLSHPGRSWWRGTKVLLWIQAWGHHLKFFSCDIYKNNGEPFEISASFMVPQHLRHGQTFMSAKVSIAYLYLGQEYPLWSLSLPI